MQSEPENRPGPESPSLRLLPITAELTATPRIRASELLSSVCDSVLALQTDRGPQPPWTGYLAEEGGSLVGTCAFKAPPEDGGVEIAYFTFPGHEDRGVATRMAGLLVDLAFAQGLRVVRAQTLPARGASTRILEKLGFRLAREVEHPDDGRVWEWEKPAPAR